MIRTRNKHYQRNVMLAMFAYVAVMLLIWPLGRTTPSMPLKFGIALTPLVPLVYVIWQMARRIWGSDELEQRTHLVGLGVATAAVAVFSLVGGFLATAKLLSRDSCAALLMWVFPVLVFSYGAARWWVARQYGIQAGCDDDDSAFPMYQRMLAAAALIGVVAVWAFFRGIDSFRLGLLSGMAAGLIAVGAVLAVRRWLRRHEPRE